MHHILEGFRLCERVLRAIAKEHKLPIHHLWTTIQE
jgi:hypothetical protein